MRKILISLGAVIFTAGASMASVVQPPAAHGVDPVLILSAQSDVMPDFALSGGDGRPI